MVNINAYEVPEPGVFDNGPVPGATLPFKPLASALGAELEGVDLRHLDDESFKELEAALFHHQVLCIRDQTLTLDDQERLTLRFGLFGVDAYTAGIEGHENVQRVVKEADERAPMVFGGAWHTDSAFLSQPPAISMLYGTDVPPVGGDTWFASTTLAYQFLSETMRHVVDSLRVHMSARNVLAAIKPPEAVQGAPRMTAVSGDYGIEEEMVRGSCHPLVRTHPITGKRGLYVDQTYAVGIEGMKPAESAALIGFLVGHITQPVFTARVRWAPGTVLMWDNRTTIHHAFNDYDGHRREMYRTIVAGEVPQ
jgi:alpha-ketoglutarate-dependent taurine dioxygenase